VPLRKATPYEEPVRKELEGEVYTLNPELVGWAFRLTKDLALPDSDSLRSSRARLRRISECGEATIRHTGRHALVEYLLARLKNE